MNAPKVLLPSADSFEEALLMAMSAACPPEAALYLLIDASRSPDISVLIDALCDDALCLFDGQAFEDLSEVAPWLVPIPAGGSDVFDWFMSDGWGNDWGMFLIAEPNAARVKTSLKRSLRVQDENEKNLFFKFFRPSVFNSYVPAMEPDQVQYILRDFREVWTEAVQAPGTPEAETVNRFGHQNGALTRNLLVLGHDRDT